MAWINKLHNLICAFNGMSFPDAGISHIWVFLEPMRGQVVVDVKFDDGTTKSSYISEQLLLQAVCPQDVIVSVLQRILKVREEKYKVTCTMEQFLRVIDEVEQF